MPSDREILRQLACRVKDIAHDPLNSARRRSWRAMHGLNMEQPMVLCEWSGVADPRKPFQPDLHCSEEWTRNIEASLLVQIWRFEWLKDDHVVEPFFNVNWSVKTSDYGVEVVHHRGDNAGRMASRRWDPPIQDIDGDFGKLHPRSFDVDRAATESHRRRVEEFFGDILPVRIRGGFWWTMGLTMQAIYLIGLEQLMLAMYDNPAGLHRLMGFLCDDHVAYARWLEAQGLLSLNNENDYIGSGSEGYVPDLPRADRPLAGGVRTTDQWVLLESQETVGVGPELFEEFIFPYQRRIAEMFGLVYYGCCEPVHTRWKVLRKLGNLRAVSIAPWADEESMAEALGSRYVYSRKPNPTLISTERFDEEAIRQDLRRTLSVAKRRRCNVEIIMKDVHTLNNEPAREARWVELAREEISRAY